MRRTCIPADYALRTLRRSSRDWDPTTLAKVKQATEDPFKILVSTVLSARTKDEVTLGASKRLFALAPTAHRLARLRQRRIERAIFPVGFYRTKARHLKSLALDLLKKFDARVPDNLNDLLELKGVGRKTANLVITLAFRKPGICVDTHVHRISNRWGLVRTRHPKETEFALCQVLPKKYWISFNELLVSFGQNVCRPVSPRCSACPVNAVCPKIGVRNHR